MIFSSNEWDNLREVVIGTAASANFPTQDLDFKESMTNSAWTETEFQFGPISAEIIERANIV